MFTYSVDREAGRCWGGSCKEEPCATAEVLDIECCAELVCSDVLELKQYIDF